MRYAHRILPLLLLAGCGTPATPVLPPAAPVVPVAAPTATDVPSARETAAIANLNRLGIERASRISVDIGDSGRRGIDEPTHFRDEDLLILRDLPDLSDLSI